VFTAPPSDAEWQAQLAGQTRITVSAQEALKAAWAAWRQAIRTANDHDSGGPRQPHKR
jgi:hypothetical protein